jgi:PPOX class probable F420-dependent enzyme
VTADDEFGSLGEARYVSLTTFKRDGTPVSTPVWVASDDGRRLLVWSGARTLKVRRLARDPRVLVARCDFKGRESGPRAEGTAAVIDDGELGASLMRRKYGWQKQALDAWGRVARLVSRRPPAPAVTIEIVSR